MSLNSEVEEGLDPTFSVDDYMENKGTIVTAPGKTAGKSPDPVIAVPVGGTKDLGTPTDKQLFGNGTVPGSLPEIKAQFALVTEQSSRIVDLHDVEEVILGKSAISQEDAKLVSGYMPDFLTGGVSLREFSKTPTKTNYKYTLNRIQSKIAAEQIVLKENIVGMLDLPFKEIDPNEDPEGGAVPMAMTMKTFEKLRNDYQSIVNGFTDTLNDVTGVQNYVFLLTAKDFANILTVPVLEVSDKVNSNDKGELQGRGQLLFNAMRPVLTSYQLRHFITRESFSPSDSVIGDNDIGDFIVMARRTTLAELLDFYKSGRFLTNLMGLEASLNANISLFAEIKGKITECGGEPSKITEVVMACMEDLAMAVRRTSYIHEVLKNLLLLNYAVYPMLQFLQQAR